ncbi:LysR family transcriptional regulator [Amnibacterium sp.]|uniref:LysR family transcriptional regulator n=1 Tax=Amnibacterium sp. TaxID=1872496 RepID=UPI00262F1A25|nr:LysR family transcriptional regulator [Amnibacterium sp.]MCU1472024.1 LysR family transcriptional regulator [Amnibacterium sp.]
MLDVRKLNMLAELDRLGTITAVARSLNLTPPGISMQLAALERELGVKLLEKQGRRVVVTPAGHLLAKHGSRIVDALSVAEMEAAALRDGAAGTYRVGAFPTAARTILPSAWKALNDAGDRTVELRLVELEPSAAIPALTAGEIELAIAHSYSNMPPVTGPGLSIRNIGTEVVRLAIDARSWRGPTETPVDLAEFAAHDWIVPSREWTCHDMVRRATDLAGFEARSVAEATDFQVQLALVQAGVGVALIPELGARNVPDGVVLLDLAAPVHRNLLMATRRSSATDAGLVHIQDLIADAARAQLPAEDHGRR